MIADDEVHARERLRDLLDRFELFDIVSEAADGNEALGMIVAHTPTVAFLDINMPGVSVFQSIPSLAEPPLIVFQTAYSEHAAKAFDIDALDYLLKPVRFERLEKTVARIRERLVSSAPAIEKQSSVTVSSVDQISITVGGTVRVISTDEIIRISFENGFCYLYILSEKLMSDKFLNYYEEKLQDNCFFRTSRTDIINLHHLAAIRRLVPGIFTIELKNGMQIDLSRRRAQALRAIIDF
ncbi:MAG: response regulator transcription factor [Chitinispirillaceae bacterium]|nr:response regulator transcription factor [Chitinispirillaceae bacterium]